MRGGEPLPAPPPPKSVEKEGFWEKEERRLRGGGEGPGCWASAAGLSLRDIGSAGVQDGEFVIIRGNWGAGWVLQGRERRERAVDNGVEKAVNMSRESVARAGGGGGGR